jgi:hypothetical protein
MSSLLVVYFTYMLDLITSDLHPSITLATTAHSPTSWHSVFLTASGVGDFDISQRLMMDHGASQQHEAYTNHEIHILNRSLSTAASHLLQPLARACTLAPQSRNAACWFGLMNQEGRTGQDRTGQDSELPVSGCRCRWVWSPHLRGNQRSQARGVTATSLSRD